MLCRDSRKATNVRNEIVDSTGNVRVHTLTADVGEVDDVRRVASELQSLIGPDRGIDGLICNAGALLHSLTKTRDGHETTLATHLIYGSYLLTNLLAPVLARSTDPRMFGFFSFHLCQGVNQPDSTTTTIYTKVLFWYLLEEC